MKTRLATLLLALQLALTVTFLAAGTATAETSDRPMGTPSPDSALVYIIRHGMMSGSAMTTRIFCDDKLIAVVPNGNYSFARVPQGTHLIWIRAGMGGGAQPLPFDFANGQTYYIRFKIKQPLSPLSADEGVLAISEAKAYHELSDGDRRKGEETVANDWPALKEKFRPLLAYTDSIIYTAPASTEGLIKVPMGTPIRAVLQENLNSEFNQAGDRVWLTVADSIQVGGAVLVQKGSTIKTVVRGSKGGGAFGSGGRLDATALSVVAADGTLCPLVGQITSAAAVRSTVVSSVLFGVMGAALTTGHADVHPAGEMVDVFTRQDVWISPVPAASVETPAPPAPDPAIQITGPELVKFNLTKSQFPITLIFKVAGAPSFTAADLIAVNNTVLPRPTSATKVTKSAKGFDVEFTGWNVCRFLSAEAGDVRLTLRLIGADGAQAIGVVTVSVGSH